MKSWTDNVDPKTDAEMSDAVVYAPGALEPISLYNCCFLTPNTVSG